MPQHSSREPAHHGDPGLQPERTTLAWGRTMLSVAVVGAVFLRWLPHYGGWMVALAGASAAVALWIYVTQRRRYQRQAGGIRQEALSADVAAVVSTTATVALLGGLGILAVLTAR
ncbi:DUF202 domain-containing protein [Zhihengliuella somnathii]